MTFSLWHQSPTWLGRSWRALRAGTRVLPVLLALLMPMPASAQAADPLARFAGISVTVTRTAEGVMEYEVHFAAPGTDAARDRYQYTWMLDVPVVGACIGAAERFEAGLPDAPWMARWDPQDCTPLSGGAVIVGVASGDATLPITVPAYLLQAGSVQVPVTPPRLIAGSAAPKGGEAPVVIDPAGYWCVGAFFDVRYPPLTGPGGVPVVPCYQ